MLKAPRTPGWTHDRCYRDLSPPKYYYHYRVRHAPPAGYGVEGGAIRASLYYSGWKSAFTTVQ